MRAMIYARVSTERQAERGTIGSQVEALRAHVAAAGDKLAGEYCDDGPSGARLDRPGPDGMRDAAEAGLFEVVTACPRTGSPAPTPTRSSSSTSWPGSGWPCGSPAPPAWTSRTRRPGC